MDLWSMFVSVSQLASKLAASVLGVADFQQNKPPFHHVRKNGRR